MMIVESKRLLESKMEAKIRILYNQYKQFVAFPSLPDFQITFRKALSSVDSLHRIDFSTVNMLPNGNIQLITLLENDKILGKAFSSHYYHEFTHIYDHVTLGQNVPTAQRTAYLKIYSEFHATIIEMQKAFGFASENERKVITGQSIPNLNDNPAQFALIDYIKHLTSSIEENMREWISEYNKSDKSNNTELRKLYKSCINQAVYYLSRFLFTQKYCPDAEKIALYFNLELFNPLLGDCFITMLDLLKEEPITEVELKSINDLLEKSKHEFLKSIGRDT